MDWLTEFEIGILDGIQNIRCGILDGLFTLITQLGDAGIIWIIIAVICLFFKKTRKTGICMGMALIMGLLFGNLLLKNAIARERPYTYEIASMTADKVKELISLPHDYSFPSGHTQASFAAATSVFMYNKKYGTAAYVLAALIAFSRMYIYVHFPTDIIGGMLLGIIYGIVSFYLIKRFAPRFEKKVS
ncbi:MAG: phosphatase PAP2 family protein [Ruminococcaceae bacterium]|nr:phosphatase PAP2 family protein [Oscillospiraceae bacterium]